MIIGVGVDLVDMRRIKKLLDKFGEKFVQKIFTKEERLYAAQSPHFLHVYANRFAAKEAAVKALGTGMREGIGWKDIETARAPSGAPLLYFHRKAYEKLVSRVPPGYTGCIHVSFSDEPPYSTAFVVISAIPIEQVLP
jgi:holo-[acyl-carrier protein] synthase